MIDILDFHVVGELKANPERLLLLGDDGQCSTFDLATGQEALEADDSWALDVTGDRSPDLALQSMVARSAPPDQPAARSGGGRR